MTLSTRREQIMTFHVLSRSSYDEAPQIDGSHKTLDAALNDGFESVDEYHMEVLGIVEIDTSTGIVKQHYNAAEFENWFQYTKRQEERDGYYGSDAKASGMSGNIFVGMGS